MMTYLGLISGDSLKLDIQQNSVYSLLRPKKIQIPTINLLKMKKWFLKELI